MKSEFPTKTPKGRSSPPTYDERPNDDGYVTSYLRHKSTTREK